MVQNGDFENQKFKMHILNILSTLWKKCRFEYFIDFHRHRLHSAINDKGVLWINLYLEFKMTVYNTLILCRNTILSSVTIGKLSLIYLLSII